MKTLILYSSRYGFTEKCAEKLANLLGESSEVKDMNDISDSELKNAVGLIIGTPVYMGQVPKAVKKFFERYGESLQQKRLGVFLCCGLPEQESLYFMNNIPKDIQSLIKVRGVFGGVLDKSKMKWHHRLITQMMENIAKKENKPEPTYIEGSIEKFALQWTQENV